MTKKGKVKYKKPPQAPRRFKSAYMFYSTVKHKEIREEFSKEGRAEKTTNIAKLVSQAWKDMDPEEREKWDEKARQDKARFEVEKTMYTGPWKIPAKKRTPKDPNAPKRPMSAFLSFSHARRAKVKDENPDMSNVEVSRVLAKMWKDAPDEERKSHIDEEFRLRQRYKTAMATWREANEREILAQRQEREDIALRRIADGSALIEEQDDTGQLSGEAQHSMHSSEHGYPPGPPGAYAYPSGASYYYGAPYGGGYPQQEYYTYPYPGAHHSYGSDQWSSTAGTAEAASAYRDEAASQNDQYNAYANVSRSYQDGSYGGSTTYSTPIYNGASSLPPFGETSSSSYSAGASGGSMYHGSYYGRGAGGTSYQGGGGGGHVPASSYKY